MSTQMPIVRRAVAFSLCVALVLLFAEKRNHVIRRLIWNSAIASESCVSYFGDDTVGPPPPPRPGNGRILIYAPPPEARIFRLDQGRSYADNMLALRDLPSLTRDPIGICARLNEQGLLENVRIEQSCHDPAVDAFVKSRIENWAYTKYATGLIRFYVAPAAKQVQIDLRDESFVIYAERIAEPKYLVNCGSDFSVTWSLN